MTDANEGTHWIEVVDGEGIYPAKRLGPYASARLADRAVRGVLRLLNARRYSVTIVSQQPLQARQQNAEING